ncbi:MAG: DISARM system phospholipase D-like protein DrmC [Paludibaculum sp.]
MTAAEACLKLVEELPSSLVESLIANLRCGAPLAMPSPKYQGRVDEFIRFRMDIRHELAPMLEVALAARRAEPTTQLVWTGPSTSVVKPRQTEQALLEVVSSAKNSLTVTSFGIFQVMRLAEELERAAERGVLVRIVLGDREMRSEQEILSQRQQLGKKITGKVSLLQWTPERRTRDERGHAGVMHAKVAVADSQLAFITSANLTEAAFEINMELGVIIRGGKTPASIDRLINDLLESGDLRFI